MIWDIVGSMERGNLGKIGDVRRCDSGGFENLSGIWSSRESISQLGT